MKQKTTIVKGCLMPALSRRCAMTGRNSSGQASDKPRGRKPRDA